MSIDYRTLEMDNVTIADEKGAETYKWLSRKPKGDVGKIVEAGNGNQVKFISIEGTSGLGKTTIINKLSDCDNIKPFTLDFNEFLETRPKEEKKILNWSTKSSDAVMAGFYNEYLNQKITKEIENVPSGVEVLLSDRAKLSDTIYNLLFSCVEKEDKNLPTAEIVEKFKARWENYAKVLCKNYASDLESYIIVIDSVSNKVLDRIAKRDTPLDRKFIAMFENYPEVQSHIWSYIAEDLKLPLIDMQGGFVSDNIEGILRDCGVKICWSREMSHNVQTRVPCLAILLLMVMGVLFYGLIITFIIFF